MQTRIRSETPGLYLVEASYGRPDLSLRLGVHPILPGRAWGDTLDRPVPNPLHAGTYPGLLLRCKPIGVLEVLQTSKGRDERNDRNFAVPDRFPFEGDLQDVRRLPKRAIEELKEFFVATEPSLPRLSAHLQRT